jgi:nicotinate phosphoribosyltransferase
VIWLNTRGLETVTIFASGNLDEYQLLALLSSGAPIDGFGVGTALDTSSDAPSLDCAYKLQEYAGRPRRKRSEGKATWPGRKQVYRNYTTDGRMAGDVLALEEHDAQPGEALIHLVMRAGCRVEPQLPLMALREKVLTAYTHLPEALGGLDTAPAYHTEVSVALQKLAGQVDRSEI